MKKLTGVALLVSLILAIAAFTLVSISKNMELDFEMDDFDE